jgi:hypothetical protein
LSISLASHLAVTTRSVTGPDGQFDGLAVTDLQIGAGAPAEDLQRDLEAVERANQRAPEPLVAQHVARLMVRTKMRVQGQLEAKLLADTMVTDLRQYPADVAARACDEWVERGGDAKFFPSWSELREICERLVHPRQMLRRALREALERAHNPPPKPSVPERETHADRVRGLRNSYRRIGDHVKAAKFERDLAQLDGRQPEYTDAELQHIEPEARAQTDGQEIYRPLEPGTEPTSHLRAPAPPSLSPSMNARSLRSAATFHRLAGRVAYAERLERQADAIETGGGIPTQAAKVAAE